MRIIEHNDELNHVCPHCNSVLGVEVKDVHPCMDEAGRRTLRLKNGSIIGSTGLMYFYHCPACHDPVPLKQEEIPQRWWKTLEPTGA